VAAAVATKFILTIEPSPDPDPAPAATKYLAGDFAGDTAMLSVADGATLGNDFSGASGSFILQTPSTAGVAGDYASGIWWLDPAGPVATLALPVLPAGWLYEGWVVGPDGRRQRGTVHPEAAGGHERRGCRTRSAPTHGEWRGGLPDRDRPALTRSVRPQPE